MMGKPAGESCFPQEEGMLADKASSRVSRQVWAPGGMRLPCRVVTVAVPTMLADVFVNPRGIWF